MLAEFSKNLNNVKWRLSDMLELLFYMNGMGSLFFILHMLLVPIEKRFLSPNYRVFIYRLNLMFFVVPFPACFFYVRRYFDNFVTSLPVAPFINNGAHFIIHLEQNLSFILPKLNYLEIFIVSVWFIIMTYKYMCFSSNNRKLRKFNRFLSSIQQEQIAKCPFNANELVHSALKDLNMKINPRIFLQDRITSPHVSGIFHVTICLPSCWEVAEPVYYMAIRHELAHVRHKDLLFQRIALIARIVSWFNPFLYIMCAKMSACDELAADVCACNGAPVSYRKSYQTALLCLASNPENQNDYVKNLVFKKQRNKFTKERILTMNNKNLSKHKLIKLIATTFVTIVLFAISTIPTLAYNLPATLEIQNLAVDSIDTVSINQLSQENKSDSFLSSTHAYENELYSFSNSLDFSKSNWYCIDENGVIYDNNTTGSCIVSCPHEYSSAQILHHRKYSNGNCSIEYYNARKCHICKYILETDHIATTTFDNCPH